MNRDEAARAVGTLSSSPAASWIGNKIVGSTLLQKCTRCGAAETLEMPTAVVQAFQYGMSGSALARQVPPDFDAKLLAWKRDFQHAHESCVERRVTGDDHHAL